MMTVCPDCGHAVTDEALPGDDVHCGMCGLDFHVEDVEELPPEDEEETDAL
jgi:uncharacterized protein (DUF983 family)